MEYFCCRFAGRRIYTSFTLITTHLEGAHQVLVNAHHASSIIELATIVRRRKHRHELAVEGEAVTVATLVTADDEIKIESRHKLLHNVGAE